MEPGENGVSGDDFFGVVRRRHPDIDIIVLPQVEPTDRPVTPVDPADLAAVPDWFDAELTALWSEVADGVERPQVSSRWTNGPLAGSVSREALLAVEGVGSVTAHQALSRAQRALTASGWHVLTPPDGMPRVLASRGGEAGRRELQVVYVGTTSRYVVTYRTGPYVVGHAAVRVLVGGAS